MIFECEFYSLITESVKWLTADDPAKNIEPPVKALEIPKRPEPLSGREIDLELKMPQSNIQSADVDKSKESDEPAKATGTKPKVLTPAKLPHSYPPDSLGNV